MERILDSNIEDLINAIEGEPIIWDSKLQSDAKKCNGKCFVKFEVLYFSYF